MPDAVNSADYIAGLQSSSRPSFTDETPQLGQADFLRLLTTQLQNQDPNEPMDPTAFVTDLTQMSQLEATSQTNEAIQSLATGFQSMQTAQAASLIGKSVEAKGTEFSHTKEVESTFTLQTDKDLTDVKVVISDGNGVVKELSAENINDGEILVKWDGTDDVGAIRDTGQFELVAFGTDENGDIQGIDTIVSTKVNSVNVEADGSMKLALATGEIVNMTDVRQISA